MKLCVCNDLGEERLGQEWEAFSPEIRALSTKKIADIFVQRVTGRTLKEVFSRSCGVKCPSHLYAAIEVLKAHDGLNNKVALAA